MIFKSKYFCYLWLFSALAVQLTAQYPTFDGCPDLTDDDFVVEHLISDVTDPTLDQPLRMDFYLDGAGETNIYFAERLGTIKYFEAATGEISIVGVLELEAGLEAGIVGLKLDPDFENKRHVYIYYTPPTPMVYRLSRFTLDGFNTLDHSSEVVLFEIPDKRIAQMVHTGGAMDFDSEGNLWITIGEHQASHTAQNYHSTTDSESSAEDEAPDTYSLYGKLLRIHPEPDGSYTVPAGNLGEHWSAIFASEGRTEMATLYADTSVVRPEIYAMGFRNPFSMTIDQKTGYINMADCQGECKYSSWNGVKHECPEDEAFEEHHIIMEPNNYGWPYFQGNNFPFAHNEASEKDPDNPVNNSPFHLGADTLPPAMGAAYTYNNVPSTNSICAVGGTIYNYDRNLPSREKLPPHFDGVYLVSDYGKYWIRGLAVNSTGQVESVIGDLFSTINPQAITLDLRQGPDGNLYMLNFGQNNTGQDNTTGIYRIAYQGDCQLSPVQLSGAGEAGISFKMVGDRGIITGQGKYRLEFFNLEGKSTYSIKAAGNTSFPLDDKLNDGVLLVKITGKNSAFTQKLYRYR